LQGNLPPFWLFTQLQTTLRKLRFPEPNRNPFGSKSKGKLSPRSYSIQFERKCKPSFLSVEFQTLSARNIKKKLWKKVKNCRCCKTAIRRIVVRDWRLSWSWGNQLWALLKDLGQSQHYRIEEYTGVCSWKKMKTTTNWLETFGRK